MKGISRLLFIVLSFAVAPTALAFDPGNIISDRDMTDTENVSVSLIDRFLAARNGILDTLLINTKKVSQIIYDAGIAARINPKVLLVMLQKEQSLVEDPTPTQGQLDWAMGYAVCDSCSKDDPNVQAYMGFTNQVTSAADRLRYYFDTPNFLRRAGQSYSVDNVSVTMQNQATANLYNYTPHLHGNQVFYNLWNKWFARNYPDGSLLQVDGQVGIWLIQDGKRRPFTSKSAFLSSYDPTKVLKVTNTDIEKYDIGTPIKYPNYSLLRMPTGGVYILIDNIKHPIASRQVFMNLGFNPEELVDATEEDLRWYPKGDSITLDRAYPQGALLKDPETGGVWYVENGVKYPVWSPEILRSRFQGRVPVRSTIEELSLYLKGDPVKFRDGEIVASKDPNSNYRSVYVISGGLKRPIASRDAFNLLGYKWTNIIWTSDRVLELHGTGDFVDAIQ